MVIRDIQASDLAEVARLFYETVHHINAQDYSPEQLKAWAPEIYDQAYWQERFQQYQVYIAEEQGQVVGFAEFEPTGHIDCFYVHHQWQRCGVGSQLITQIEADARKQNLARLFADVSITARPFFEHHGFSVEREQERLYRDVLFQQFLMSKQLVNPEGEGNAGLEGRLREAIANLDWMSEADYPFELRVWETSEPLPLTIEQMRVLVDASPELPITEIDFTVFFEPATRQEGWYGEEEVAIAQQYQRLTKLFQTELSHLQVFKVGQQELDIYVIGHTPDQTLMGIKTKAIET